MKKINFIAGVLAVFVVFSCDSSSDSTDNEQPNDPVPAPVAATLVFPANNSECNEGTVLNDLESNVTFQWNAAQNTDSYRVTLTNLNNGASVNTTVDQEQATITIARGTPYEWSVTSLANASGQTAESAKWRFFNEGPGITNYAPFPAEAVFPERSATVSGESGQVSLQWKVSDVDDDIESAQVFFGEAGTEPIFLGTTAENSFEVSVGSATVYEWYVVITDAAGNTSTSEIFGFRVD